MRPSVEEQLQGTCRILEDVVAPCVNDPLARTLLDGVVANLRMLTAALPGVAPFLRQDNQATGQLLAQLSRSVSPELAERVALALAVPEPDAADTAALDAHNRLLRELMAEAVCSAQLTPEQHRAVVAHMSARASRMPMRYVATAPSPASPSSPSSQVKN